jgi:cell division protein FtsI (penicillin-binding protein 3)
VSRALDSHGKQRLRHRIKMIGVAFGVVFVVLLGRAVDLQVIQQSRLQALADREIMRYAEIVPRRGVIYDRNQEELAVSLDTESVWARPLTITTPIQTGQALADALGLSVDEVIKRLKQEKSFVWVARRVSPERAQAVRALELNGVGLMTEPRRFYPYTTLACHVLGFAGLDARGLEGVEAQYDHLLKGQPHKVASLRDALGRTIQLTPAAFSGPPEGHQLILTLDKSLQYQVEKILSAAVARYNALGGMAVVIAPRTGEILALASVPVFNPNVFGRYPKETYRNRVITDTFEPGSTFKMFVAAAGLISGKVTPDSRFFCENGEWTIGGRVIHDTHSYGQLSLSEIVKFSSNIGAAKVGQVVGGEALHHTFQAFGFGKESAVDLPGESRGILRPYRNWRPVDLANICFGQGVAVTGLQLTQAVAAIANGGLLMKPFLVRGVVDQNGRLAQENLPQEAGRVMTPAQAKALTDMLALVTQPGGTGTQARVDPYLVAGKTGTAQKLDPEGGYSDTDYMSSFVGFLPADDPKAAILVTLDSPRGQHYGGVVAGPAWASIARAALDSLGVHPAGSGPRRLEASPVAPTRPARLAADPAPALAAGKVPDLRGFTLRQVLKLEREAKLAVRVKGWGRVVEQDPAPGQPLATEAMHVTLRPAEGGA